MNILFQFDIRTIAVFVGLTFLVQTIVIGAQAYLIRDLKQYRGVGAALLANLLIALGLTLRLFADYLPGFVTTVVSNTVIVAAPGLMYVALSQFLSLKYSRAFVMGVIASVLFLLLYFTYAMDDIGSRAISLSLGSVTMVSILIYQLWHAQKTALRFSANLMLGVFLVHGMLAIIRTISLILNPLETLSLSPTQSATYLFSFALSFFWSMGFVLMVSQRLRNDLMEIATIDVLTRIPNRRATQAFLERELSRTQRNQHDFAILLIDLDNFKQVNDRWGHAIGDSVLVKTASIFQSMIRKQDFVGRWGGEEFLMIVPGPTNAAALAERVRRAIADANFGQGAATFRITTSIGGAIAGHSDPLDQVLKKTDQALYRAKQTKNTVSLAWEN